MGNCCHFHSFYDTPGWHIIKVLFPVSVSGHRLYLYFQIITELNSCP